MNAMTKPKDAQDKRTEVLYVTPRERAMLAGAMKAWFFMPAEMKARFIDITTNANLFKELDTSGCDHLLEYLLGRA